MSYSLVKEESFSNSLLLKGIELVGGTFTTLILSLSATPLVNIVKSQIFHMLTNVHVGELVIEDENGDVHRFGDYGSKPTTTLKVLDSKFWIRGLAESYMYNEIELEDITGFLQLLLASRKKIQEKSLGISYFFKSFNATINTKFLNSIHNTLHNISAHYDLGNDMFKHFLDRSLTYSCPIWNKVTNEDQTEVRSDLENEQELYEAQIRKLHYIIDKAQLQESDHLLEIGSGWGSLAIEAVKLTGCRVTTLTLSSEQKELAEQRISDAGFSEKIEVKLMDYRDVADLKIQFDKIISIEMLEAVGKEYLSLYFEICHKVLKKDTGIMVFQVITLTESRYDNYCKNVDFIQKYIFPGGHTPSITALINSITLGSKGLLSINELIDIGPHYVKALRLWRQWFDTNFTAIERTDPKRYNQQFKRTWLYYFSYCEAAFATRCTNDVIVTLTRPNNATIGQDVPY